MKFVHTCGDRFQCGACTGPLNMAECYGNEPYHCAFCETAIHKACFSETEAVTNNRRKPMCHRCEGEFKSTD